MKLCTCQNVQLQWLNTDSPVCGEASQLLSAGYIGNIHMRLEKLQHYWLDRGIFAQRVQQKPNWQLHFKKRINLDTKLLCYWCPTQQCQTKLMLRRSGFSNNNSCFAPQSRLYTLCCCCILNQHPPTGDMFCHMCPVMGSSIPLRALSKCYSVIYTFSSANRNVDS